MACVPWDDTGADIPNTAVVREVDLFGGVGYEVDADCPDELSGADDIIGAVVDVIDLVLEDDKDAETRVLV